MGYLDQVKACEDAARETYRKYPVVKVGDGPGTYYFQGMTLTVPEGYRVASIIHDCIDFEKAAKE